MDFEKLPSFSAADISIIIHATEDKNKILESICSSFSIDANKFRHTELIGHWGNRISLLTGNLESAEANRLVQKIVLSLSSVERNHLLSSSHSFIDEQRICQKRISLSEMDSIRLRFKPARRFKFNSNYDI
jgi:RNA binding exosome subunit